jgi:hypothetical protein
MMLSYVAPEFLYRVKFNKLILKLGIGAGVFVFTEHLTNNEIRNNGRVNVIRNGSGSQTGGGVHLTLGLEYMMTKKWGLGLSMNEVMGILPKPEDVYLEDTAIYGIDRVNLMAGIRYYFGK